MEVWADFLEPGRTLAVPFLTCRRRLMDLAGRPEEVDMGKDECMEQFFFGGWGRFLGGITLAWLEKRKSCRCARYGVGMKV